MHKKITIALSVLVLMFSFISFAVAEGEHKLIEAVKAGDEAKVKELVSGGYNIEEMDSYKNTPLMWAAGGGNLELVKYLIEKGANVNAVGVHGWTVLMGGAGSGSVEVVNYLLSKGADPNAKDKYGNSALDAATFREHTAVVEVLKGVTK